MVSKILFTLFLTLLLLVSAAQAKPISFSPNNKIHCAYAEARMKLNEGRMPYNDGYFVESEKELLKGLAARCRINFGVVLSPLALRVFSIQKDVVLEALAGSLVSIAYEEANYVPSPTNDSYYMKGQRLFQKIEAADSSTELQEALQLQ